MRKRPHELDIDVDQVKRPYELDIDVDQVQPEIQQEEDDIMDEGTAQFPPLTVNQLNKGIVQTASVNIPKWRLHPLKKSWMSLYQPIVEHMKLQIRYNTANSCVELRTSEHTEDIGALQKSVDFIRAFVLGFAVEDAIALLRIDDLFIDSFQIDDVKTLHGDHLSRAIGRIAGKDGKTKFTIENATKTRIVLADKHIHILGSFANIKIARDAICQLILGAPPGQVYNKLKIISSRSRERF